MILEKLIKGQRKKNLDRYIPDTELSLEEICEFASEDSFYLRHLHKRLLEAGFSPVEWDYYRRPNMVENEVVSYTYLGFERLSKKSLFGNFLGGDKGYGTYGITVDKERKAEFEEHLNSYCSARYYNGFILGNLIRVGIAAGTLLGPLAPVVVPLATINPLFGIAMYESIALGSMAVGLASDYIKNKRSKKYLLENFDITRSEKFTDYDLKKQYI